MNINELQQAISQIDSNIKQMAGVQNLPHDALRTPSNSLAAQQKALNTPEFKTHLYGSVRVAHNAKSSPGEGDNHTQNFGHLHKLIRKTDDKLKQAHTVREETLQELASSKEHHDAMVANHALSLLEDIDIAADSINIAALNQSAIQQKLSNAENAISLLMFKRHLYQDIQQGIRKQVQYEVYEKSLQRLRNLLKGFARELDIAKTAGRLARPDLWNNTAMARDAGTLKEGGELYDGAVIDVIKQLFESPDNSIFDGLNSAIQKGLISDSKQADELSSFILEQFDILHDQDGTNT